MPPSRLAFATNKLFIIKAYISSGNKSVSDCLFKSIYFIDPCLPSGDSLPYQFMQKTLNTESLGSLEVIFLESACLGLEPCQHRVRHSVNVGQINELMPQNYQTAISSSRKADLTSFSN